MPAFKAVSRLKRLVAGFSSRKAVFETEWVHVRFVVYKVILVQVLQSVSVSVLPSVHHSNFNLHSTLTRTTSGRILGSIQQIIALPYIYVGEHGQKGNVVLVSTSRGS
jgi:hypothetical protein